MLKKRNSSLTLPTYYISSSFFSLLYPALQYNQLLEGTFPLRAHEFLLPFHKPVYVYNPDLDF